MLELAWMLLAAGLLCVGSPAPAAQTTADTAPGLRVAVDPELELVCLVARFAGFEEFCMPNSNSPYSRAIEQHFAAQREHPAVVKLRELRRDQGVSHDAIASLGMHLGPLPALEELVPFDQDPERLDARWGGAQAREFLALLRDFAAQGRALEFFSGQAALFREVERRLGERLSGSKALAWFDDFFGARAGAEYVAVPGLLCGGRNFGVGVRFGDGSREQLTPVFGCWSFDAQGVPVFTEEYVPLLVHELCHSYTNPIVDRHLPLLAPAGAKLFAAKAAQMQRQAYANATTVLYETLVRSCVIRCRADTEGRDAGNAQAKAEIEQHFPWTPELARVLGEYQAERQRYPTFDDFMPRFAAALEQQAAALEAAIAAQPHLVEMRPANGSREVDPALLELSLHFDRAMLDQSWSVVGSPADTPAIRGAPRYDQERKVLTLPVKLEPGRRYRFGLNSASQQGFKSAAGVPLEPLILEFSTRS